MWTRAELKMRAKTAFRRNYVNAVVVAFLMGILMTLFGGENTSVRFRFNSENRDSQFEDYYYDDYDGDTGAEVEDALEELFGRNPLLAGLVTGVTMILLLLAVILQIFVINIFEVGGDSFFVRNQTDRPGIGALLDGFRSGHYGNLVLVMFFRNLFVILWSLLFVIPGIVKSYEYRMIPYILSENPGMDRKEAFLISKQMMNGKKMAAFVLDLSFIGWFLLNAFTCGLLGIFYVQPYYQATCAEMYTYNRMLAYQEGHIR